MAGRLGRRVPESRTPPPMRPRQSAQVAYLSSVFKYECELRLIFLYELSVRDLPAWTVSRLSTKSRENLEYDKVRGW